MNIRRLFLVPVLSLLSLCHSTAQQHQPTYYVSEDSLIYWNKKLPFYLKISSSPDDDGILLKNKDQKEFTNPIYFDAEGINYIRTKNAVDNQTRQTATPFKEVVLPVYADGLPPKSTMEYYDAKRYTDEQKTYFGGGLRFSLYSHDEISGIDQLSVSINSGPFQKYTDTLDIKDEGEYTIQYYAVDRVGNAEETHSENFILDLSAPVTSVLISGDSMKGAYTHGAQMSFDAFDSLSGIHHLEYKIDDQNMRVYRDQNVSLDKLSDGYHTVYFTSTDQVNNVEKEKEYEFYLDKSAPLLAADILGDRFIVDDQIYFSGRTKLKFTAVDNKSGVKEIKYSINGATYQMYDQPFYLPTATGIHSIRYYAVDNFGNRTNDKANATGYHEYVHKATKIYVDLTGPDLHYDFEGKLIDTRDTIFVNSQTKILFKAEDSESGVQKITYSLKGSAEEFLYREPLSFNQAGYHALDFYGYDNVNNRNVSHMNIFVDNKGPEVYSYFSGQPLAFEDGINIYSKDVSIYLAAADEHVNIEHLYYSVNGGSEREYNQKVKPLRKNKKHSLKIRAIDELGNESIKEIMFKLIK